MDLLTRKVIGAGERLDGLYFFRGVPQVRISHVSGFAKWDMWHRRLGHPSDKVLKMILVMSGVRQNNNVCDACLRAKQPRSSFPFSANRASCTFELIHLDLWGPYKRSSSRGASYFFTIVDDFSRGVWVYLLKNKIEVFSTFLDFVAMVDRQFELKIKRVRSDNGTEFRCLDTYFLKNGILLETSCVGTPQQNGRVERKHRHILNVARALRFQANLPIDFWGECILGAGHLINRTPTSLLNGKTPFEMLFHKQPSFDNTKVFGCLCYAHDLRHKGDKFASRSRRCIFLGYPFGKKDWRLYDLDSGDFFISRDVRFFEHIFPFVTTPVIIDKAQDISVTPNMDLDQHTDVDVADTRVEDSAPIDNLAPSEHSSSPANATEQVELQPANDDLVTLDTDLGRGKRIRRPNSRLEGYITHTLRKISPSVATPASTPTSGSLYPISHRNFIAAITLGREPKNHREAMRDPGWKEAMNREIRALEENETWILAPLPPGKRY
ncbi:hypothetical protein CASFOL_004566 [Castilleja foliolosa]|uniref:Integrase catalytic domain-containing protein n=1 Tax=Castilleja foliolosa TaxID=1961234 RepID=A0ABD3EEK4_9LAMI